MCDFSKGFILCSCIDDPIKFREQEFYRKVKGEIIKVENKTNDNVPLEYIWVLFKYKGQSKEVSLGRYNFPNEDLGKGLDAEWVALNLNVRNCFDFDYMPKEGDNLFIQMNIIRGPYISFIYKDEEWIIEHYSPFLIDIEKFSEGRVIASNV